MAEFCVKCYNEMNGEEKTEEEFIISDDLDLCEGCAEYKHVIICEKRECVLGFILWIINTVRYFILDCFNSWK
jgi:hypothetical protein